MKIRKRLRYGLEYLPVKAIFAGLDLLPFRLRRRVIGALMVHVIAPLAGYRRRIRTNLDFVWPDLDPTKKSALPSQVSRHIGETLCELSSPKDLLRMARDTKIEGQGLAALEEARTQGRPAIVVSGHFGNYDIVRAGLIANGFNVGALYRRMNNPYFHDFYFDKISQIGMPLFERGRPGLGHMVKHLKSGGTLAALIDVRSRYGEYMPFLGQPARTSTAMAELALRYDAVLIPFFGTRLPDNWGFKAELEQPIPHSDPETMTASLTAALEARIHSHPEQWFWIHNRWKDAER